MVKEEEEATRLLISFITGVPAQPVASIRIRPPRETETTIREVSVSQAFNDKLYVPIDPAKSDVHVITLDTRYAVNFISIAERPTS